MSRKFAHLANVFDALKDHIAADEITELMVQIAKDQKSHLLLSKGNIRRLEASRKSLAATLDETLDRFVQQGTPPDVAQRIREMPFEQMPWYIGALRKNPSADWDTLSSSVVIPKKQAPQWSNFELQLVGRYDPTFRQWALIQLRKMRVGQDNYGDYSYRGFEDMDERAIFGRLDNMFGELYDWYVAYAREYPRFDLTSYSLAQALKRSKEWHEMMAGQGAGLYYTPLQRDESGSITDERVVYQWGDGWYVTMVTNKNDLKVEGNKMGHCVGGYCYDVERGTARIFSLRDPMHQPHITVEMDGDDNIVRQIKGRYNGAPDDEHRERMAEWLQSLDNARWRAKDSSDDDDIYWGSHPDEIRGAIYDTVYGRDDEYYEYYDEDDNYGIGHDRAVKEAKNADVGELYDSAMEALGDSYWDHKSGQRVTRRSHYTDDLDQVAEALADVAVATDKAKMQEVIANGIPKPPRYRWDEYDKQTPFEKGYYWWMNHSQVKALHDKMLDNLDEYRTNNMGKDDDWSDRVVHELGSILPYGMDFVIDKHIKSKIDEEYLSLFQQITGRHALPLDNPLDRSSSLTQFDRNHPRLFTHVSDFGYFGETVPHDPETGKVDGSKYDGEWKYAKRKFRRFA
jgi:hypothetical protein